MKLQLSMVSACLLFQSTSFAQPISVHTEKDGIKIDATIDASKFQVGDSIVLIIEAMSDDKTKLTITETHSYGSFMIQQQHNLLDIPTRSGRKWVWTMHLDTFDADTTSLSGIVIDWTNDSGAQGSIELDPLPVVVETFVHTSLDAMELRDLKSAVPLVHERWWSVTLAGVLLLGFITWLIWRRSTIVEHSLPPHIIALRELQTLRDSDLDVHSFYTALSDTVRRYITTRFQLAATGQTTREFLIVAKQHARLTLHDQKNLGVFLSAADLVKFARLEPNDHTCKEAVDQAEQFITSTIPQDETPSMEYAA